MTFTITVHIRAASARDAEALREEIVGAIEDAHESGIVNAVAVVDALVKVPEAQS